MLREVSFLGVRCISSSSCVSYGLRVWIYDRDQPSAT